MMENASRSSDPSTSSTPRRKRLRLLYFCKSALQLLILVVPWGLGYDHARYEAHDAACCIRAQTRSGPEH